MAVYNQAVDEVLIAYCVHGGNHNTVKRRVARNDEFVCLLQLAKGANRIAALSVDNYIV